jgi:uncharacterized protein
MNRLRVHMRAPIEKGGRHLCKGLVITLVLCAFTGAVALAARNPARISVLMATGMPGGTYYHVGLAMASMWTTKLQDEGIRVSAAVSEGSRENIQAIRIADADLILADEFLCSMAYKGTGYYKGDPLPDLRSVACLWRDAVHVVIRSDKVQTGTIQDLAGLTLATGLPDSGNRLTAEMLVRTLKPGKKRVRLRYMSILAGAEALRKGTVQALDLTGALPVSLVTAFFHESKPPVSLLEITEAQMAALVAEGWRHVSEVEIPAETYPGQVKPLKTIGQLSILAVTSSLDAQVVYALTQSLFDNLEHLARVHHACQSISLENALEGLEVPLHPGAAQYYREQGLEIPEHLIR